MARGNWQKRVELAETRRRENKLRKQKSGDKRAHKGWVHNLLNQFDQHEATIRKHKQTLHLWTDTIPSSSPPLWDLLWENQKNYNHDNNLTYYKHRKPRSESIESEGSTGRGKKGSSSGTFKKKVHPRSKEFSSLLSSSPTSPTPMYPTMDNNSDDQDFDNLNDSDNYRDEVDDDDDGSCILLCQRNFLYDKCCRTNNAGKTLKGGGTCKYVHYDSSSKHCLNLGTILKHQDPSILQNVDVALAAANDQSGKPGAMEMLYYSNLQISSEASATLSEEITAQLARMQVPITSIVYAAVDHCLVFDRNQQGILAEAMLNITGDTNTKTSTMLKRPRQSWVENGNGHSEQDDDDVDATHLPVAVLEHILTFLPDGSVASCRQTCRAWNREIGRHSPNLWLQLLARHSWPAPKSSSVSCAITGSLANNDNEQDEQNIQVQKRTDDSRRTFEKHYVVLRNVKALASVVPSILALPSLSSSSSIEEKEVTYLSFGSRKYSPQKSDSCVALLEWAPNQVLAGYANECTLRLFQAVSFRGKEKHCKELVCQNVDPYKSTRKRTCTLDAVALDEDTIGCLCHVSASNLDSSAFILVVLSRDDFLLGESSAVAAKGGASMSEQELQVIDLGEAVLNYILSSDVADHRLLPLFDYLTVFGGYVGNVVISVSRRNIVACGYGRFMVEVSISIPNEFADIDDDENTTIQLDRKLVLFSTCAGAIVWMGDSYPSLGSPPAAAIPAALASTRRPSRGGSRMQCTIVTGSILSPWWLTICNVDPSGMVNPPSVVEDSDALRGSLLTQQIGLDVYPSRCMVVSSSDIVTKNTVYQTDNNGRQRIIRSTLTFFPLPFVENDDGTASESLWERSSGPAVLHLAGAVRIHDMVCHCEEYIIAICSELTSVVVENPGPEDLDGQWFVPNPSVSLTRESLIMVVIHVPSRQEIGRIPFSCGAGQYDRMGPRLTVQSGGTLSLALGGFGIAMTGTDVRGLREGTAGFELWESADEKACKPKKKKPARGKKGVKKDGFARGMSLNG